MLREACLVAFVIYDIGKRVVDGRRKRRARRAQAQIAQQRALRAPATSAPPTTVKQSGLLAASTSPLRGRMVFPFLGSQALIISAILSGTNLYFPQAWLAAACVCCAAIIAQISYLIIMHQMMQRKLAKLVSLSATAATQPTMPASLKLLNGSWTQDKELSDPMVPAMDLMRLNGLIRRAVGLVKGLDIRLSDDTYEFAVTSYVPGFKIWERYPFSGEERRHRRRDLRRGGASGRVSVTADGRLRTDLTWGEPHGGAGFDLYELTDDNTLVVSSTIRVSAGAVAYRSVYRRRM